MVSLSNHRKVDAPAGAGSPGQERLAPIRLDLPSLEEGLELSRGVRRALDPGRDVTRRNRPAIGFGRLGCPHHHVERGAHRAQRCTEV
jgi:hypothetical protein